MKIVPSGTIAAFQKLLFLNWKTSCQAGRSWEIPQSVESTADNVRPVKGRPEIGQTLTNAGETRAVSVFVVASSGLKGRPERVIAASFAAL